MISKLTAAILTADDASGDLKAAPAHTTAPTASYQQLPQQWDGEDDNAATTQPLSGNRQCSNNPTVEGQLLIKKRMPR
jgi:hypothetical protein